MTQKQIETYLTKIEKGQTKTNWERLSTIELAKATSKGSSQLRVIARSLGLPKKVGGVKKVEFTELPSLKDEVFAFILKSKKHIGYAELTDKFDCGMSKIKDAIEQLQKENKNFHFRDDGVEIAESAGKITPSTIGTQHLVGHKVKFGFVTDNHLGSKYERLDVLNAVYDRFAMEGITDVYNAGNVIDGEARFNKFDIHKHGMEDQCKYFAQAYPAREGMTTHFITGDDHEGWYVQREGVNIGKFMESKAVEAGRSDLHYIGHMEHDIIFKAKKGQAVMRVVHPGGGSSYAYSYTSQKIVESYTPGEKPHIVLGGHYHKACYNYIRGVHFLQGGTTMDQSPFMRKKRLEAHLGGWIVEFQQGDNGVIQSFKCEWISFYGRDFYEKDSLWQYQY